MFVFLQHQLGMEFKPFALLYPVLQIRGCVQNCKTSFKDSYRNLHGTTARYYNVVSLFTTNARYSSYQIAPVPLPIPAGITKPYTCSLLIPETKNTKTAPFSLSYPVSQHHTSFQHQYQVQPIPKRTRDQYQLQNLL